LKLPKSITNNVLILSLVSLFNDFASEMLIPVIPLYLKEIGLTVTAIGVLEGIAEAIASLGKGYFGSVSDAIGKRKPFILSGYILSAISKPLIAFLPTAAGAYMSRGFDRLGKGIRTSPRDALLNLEASHGNKGSVFGFHRAMDTAGAVLGPLAVLLFIIYKGVNYRELFIWTFLPGIITVVLLFMVREKRATPKTSKSRYNLLNFISYFRNKNGSYKKLVLILIFFALFNTADALLILKMSQAGFSVKQIIIAYIAYNCSFAALAYPLGKVSDRIGNKKVMMLGLVIFGLVYFFWGLAFAWWHFLLLFPMYGVYQAATDGVGKAWIGGLVDKSESGSALGAFHALTSFAGIVSGLVAGFLWSMDPSFPFILSGLAAWVTVTMIWKWMPHWESKEIAEN
jgi:MFS family permease